MLMKSGFLDADSQELKAVHSINGSFILGFDVFAPRPIVAAFEPRCDQWRRVPSVPLLTSRFGSVVLTHPHMMTLLISVVLLITHSFCYCLSICKEMSSFIALF